MTCAKVIHHTSTTADSYRVRRNRLGSFICIASMLNVSSMPLAAYISEYLPWRGAFTPPETHANYTSFSAATLALHQERYSNATLPAGTTFLVDDNYNTQVVRALVPVHAQPLRFGDCFATSILGLPGLSFYSDSLNNFVCNVLDNPTTLVANGSCFHLNMLSRPYDRACLWFVPGDGISSHPNKADKVVTLYFVKTELRTPAFAWFLFVYRLGTTLFVWYRLYVHYYRHCLELEARLRRFGHRLKMPAGDWSYEIVLGDPTAIVLMDAWVASLYYLDTWFGCTNIGTATLQMQDSGDAMLMLRGVMYLARTVWFAYWGLCLVSYALKRWKKQHAFKEVDPTVVAIVVTINGPAFTFMTGHVVIFARFYQWMFNCLIPRAFQGQEVEVGLVSIIFTVLTIHMPVAYGLVAGRRNGEANAPQVDCSSFRFNSIKSAAIFRVANALRITPKLPARGGTLYRAMDLNPRLKRCPTISLRGTDCFVLCYCNGELIERLRMSLLSGIDTAHAVIPRASESSEFVVNELRVPVTLETKESGPVMLVNSKYELRMSPEPSVWCI